MASALSVLVSSHGFATEQVTEKDLAFGRDPKPTGVVLSAVEAGMPALNALVSARKVVPPIPVVVFVGPDQARIAVEALKLGATDVAVMPVDPANLLSIVQSVRQKDEESASGRSKPEYSQPSAADSALFVSRSPKVLEMWNVATTVARTDVPVLILGESGVGKEVLARFIQRHSRRADKPLVKVNCSALPPALLWSVEKKNRPALRERKEDIPLLAEYFLNRPRDALASFIKELPPELIDGFIQYHWPGNAPQRKNAIRRYLILPELDMELNT